MRSNCLVSRNLSPSYATLTDAFDAEMIPLVDMVVYKIRTLNGVKRYHRWNETPLCWVDPEWIDMK